MITACGDTRNGSVPGSDIAPGDWPNYARDLGASKYSPLDQIDTDNVAGLEVAWSWESADYALEDRFPELTVNNNYQVTPIKVGERLYVATNLGQAAALDPATGDQLWLFDPYATGLRDRPTGRANRGVAHWSELDDSSADVSGGATDERIFLGSGELLGPEGRAHHVNWITRSSFPVR